MPAIAIGKPNTCFKIFVTFLLVQLASHSTAAAESTSPLTLEKAIETALTRRPELGAASWEILAAKARATQKAALPNPELGAEISSPSNEDSISISQLIEFPGKRRNRIKAAEAEIPVHENDRARTHLDIIEDVTRAFIRTIGARQKLILAQQAHETAEKFARTVTERVTAGAVSPIEETRAGSALADAAASLSAARGELAEATFSLRAAMGDAEMDLSRIAGSLPEDPVLPDTNAFLKTLDDSTNLIRWKLEKERQDAVVASQQSERFPDVTLSGKWTLDRENNETTFFAGMTVPLPLFNRNRGGIAEARAELEKIRFNARAEAVRVQSEILKRTAGLEAMATEIRIIRDRMLSAAKQAFDAVSEGYLAGKFRYLDVLEASRELAGAKRRHLELLIAFELEKTALNRLTAVAPAIVKEQTNGN